jgi:hypothetical protein
VTQTGCEEGREFCRGGDQGSGKPKQHQAKGPRNNWPDLGHLSWK